MEECSIRWLSRSHLFKWAWSKGYYWHSKFCFLSWLSPWNQQRKKIKNKTLQQTWWLEEGYSRNASCALNLISTFLFFPYSQLPFIRCNISLVQGCRVYIHKSYVILGIVPSTMIFLRECRCWRKICGRAWLVGKGTVQLMCIKRCILPHSYWFAEIQWSMSLE